MRYRLHRCCASFSEEARSDIDLRSWEVRSWVVRRILSGMDIFLIKSKNRDLCMKQSRLDFYLSLTAQRIFIHIFEHEILFLKVFSLLPNSLLPNSSNHSNLFAKYLTGYHTDTKPTAMTVMKITMMSSGCTLTG